jgi:hypothetical protein
MTALSLAIYLAALKAEVPEAHVKDDSAPRILVLDDVLIGLDMAHRVPILTLIDEQFVQAGWQVILFTYDRPWYEVTRNYLADEDWQRYELYLVEARGNDALPLLKSVDDDLSKKAENFLNEGEIKAAAVHVRAYFEKVLKTGCQGLRIPIPFQTDLKKVEAGVLWDALKVAKCPSRNGAEPEAVIGEDLKRSVSHALSWVLNPGSHDSSIEFHCKEIRDAIKAVRDLNDVIKERTKEAGGSER